MIGRWDPFAELSRLQDDMSRVTGAMRRTQGTQQSFQPAVDIFETKEGIVVKAELPGVKSEDVSITVENNLLTLSGQRKFEKETSDDGYHRVECSYGTFTRSFALPNTVNTEAIEANLDSGVLTLKLPKRAEAQPRRIQVGGGSGKKQIEAKA